jgi:adenine-specific DNA-methyltransferase
MNKENPMEKIDAMDSEAKSADLIAGNIAQFKALFPELITERAGGAAVNVDVLKALIGDATVTDSDEKYGLNWHGKRRARQLALTPSMGTLRPCPEDSVDWGTTQNLMIEGDNLEVLKLLQKSYVGKVKLIYIDPPYNTGNDFVYPDNFQDNIKNYLELTAQVEGGQKISSNTDASGRFHTDWLSMMYPRLKVAKSLLCDDGLLCVSIGERELGNLRAICDEIFGEECFKGQISRATGTPTGQGTDRLVNELDYMVIYARNSETGFLGLSMGESDSAIYDQVDAKGRYLTRPLRKTGGEDRREDRPTMYFAVLDPENNKVFPIGPGGYESRWRCGADRYKELVKEGLIEWKKIRERGGENETWKPYQRFYLDGRLKLPSNLWTEQEGNKKATRELKDLFGEKVFDFPKPMDLIRHCIQIGATKDSLILDFFAGSGTTGHSVLAQNASDGGKRRFLLVQLPEVLDPTDKNQKSATEYCDAIRKPRNMAELTKERLRRGGKQVKQDNQKFSGDTGFRVYKLDHSNIRAWQPSSDLIQDLVDSVDHILSGRSEQDVLTELLLKLGLDLCVPIEQHDIAGKAVHSIGGGVLMACLDTRIAAKDAEPLALGIAKWHTALAPTGETTCVFRDSAFAGNDVAKINLAAILEQHGIRHVRSL